MLFGVRFITHAELVAKIQQGATEAAAAQTAAIAPPALDSNDDKTPISPAPVTPIKADNARLLYEAMCASSLDKDEIARLLEILTDSDLEFRDEETGQTLLHRAVTLLDEKIIQDLYRRISALPEQATSELLNAQDKTGYTASDYIIIQGYEGVVPWQVANNADLARHVYSPNDETNTEYAHSGPPSPPTESNYLPKAQVALGNNNPGNRSTLTQANIAALQFSLQALGIGTAKIDNGEESPVLIGSTVTVAELVPVLTDPEGATVTTGTSTTGFELVEAPEANTTGTQSPRQETNTNSFFGYSSRASDPSLAASQDDFTQTTRIFRL
jgi:hypothetical protein